MPILSIAPSPGALLCGWAAGNAHRSGQINLLLLNALNFVLMDLYSSPVSSFLRAWLSLAEWGIRLKIFRPCGQVRVTGCGCEARLSVQRLALLL